MQRSSNQPIRGILDQFGSQPGTAAAIGLPIPVIDPLPATYARPLWSVVIPTYHCAHYLRETLRSVLAQDPGPDCMQIEVVDDHSTRDDPETEVRSIGGERVAFHRNPRNLGAIGNFNTCIRRARGQWVHILHGDDLVEPDFYRTLEDCMHQHPAAALLASRCRYIDGQSNLGQVSDRIPLLESFTTDPSPLFLDNQLRTPAVVVRRNFYECHGGFLDSLIHTADWEMWCRAIARQGGVMVDRPLARYRMFPGSDTSRLMRTAENLRDTARLGALLSQSYAHFDLPRFLERLRLAGWNQLQHFQDLGDEDAIRAHLEFCALLRVTDLNPRLLLKQYLKSIPLVRHLAATVRHLRSSRSGTSPSGRSGDASGEPSRHLQEPQP